MRPDGKHCITSSLSNPGLWAGWDFGWPHWEGAKCALCVGRKVKWESGDQKDGHYAFKKFYFLFTPSPRVRLHFFCPHVARQSHMLEFWLKKCQQNWLLPLSGLAHDNSCKILHVLYSPLLAKWRISGAWMRKEPKAAAWSLNGPLLIHSGL